MLTIVIPYHNGAKTLGRLLDSLPESIPVVVVDDHSDEPLQLKRNGVQVIRPETRGYFSGAVNDGIQATETDVLVLNQDVWLEGGGWLTFVHLAQKEGHAIAGDGVFGHPAWPRGYVQGTFMFLSREAINEIGGLNKRDYPLWGSTAEWQLRACRAGFSALPILPVPGLRHERQQGQRFGSSISRLLAQEPEKRNWYVRTPPAVSVIVTSHNYGRYLTDAVNSLIGGPTSLGEFPPQTFQSFEIIIVDDASSDETPQVARALADDWKAIRYIRSDRKLGSADAYNLGIKAAHGRYITILSADDMREPDSLEALYRQQEANPHAMIYDDICEFANGTRTRERRMPTYDFEILIDRNQAHAGIMFPKKAWQEAGGYPSIMNKGREDWAFNVALGVVGYCGIHVEKPGYLYRREGQGRSYTNQGPEWREFFVGQMMSLFPNVYKGERPTMCCGKGGGRGPASMSNGSGGRRMAALTVEPREGMTLIEYFGNNYGATPYYGKVTGTRYVFSKTRNRGYVRKSDVPGFEEIVEARKPAFGIVETPKGAKPEANSQTDAKEEAPQGEDGKVAPIIITSGPDTVAVATDPGEMTIAALEEYVAGKTPEQLAALLDAEKAGKGRKGAITLIEGVLYEGDDAA